VRLTNEQIDAYRRDGFLVLPAQFDMAEVEALRAAFARDTEQPGNHLVVEDGSDEVRAVYASHLRQDAFAALVRSPRMLEPALQLLGSAAYVYQVKVNAKPAFLGDSWSWHQDFGAWQIADQLERPDLVNVAIFLDDVDEFNGPVIFLPGSHEQGTVRSGRRDEHRSKQHLDPDDIALTPEQVAAISDRCGMVSAKGAAGSVVFFHPEIVHGSAANMSPHPRRLGIITYNDTSNLPRTSEPRAEYLVGRDTRALAVEDDADLALSGARFTVR
jgi:ectoine hydroxylase